MRLKLKSSILERYADIAPGTLFIHLGRLWVKRKFRDKGTYRAVTLSGIHIGCMDAIPDDARVETVEGTFVED